VSSVLEVRGLHVAMGPLEILRGIDLDVPAGGIVTVLGANGVGKTTLMRAISGVYAPRVGQVRLLGENVAGLPSHAIVARGISQAPEGRQIFGGMTVMENLRLGAVARSGGITSDLDRIFALFPVLKQRERQKAGSLSGGEQQMLCIGRALMARPKLLLLDEPSLGLAPMLVRRIFELIAEIRAAGTPILLVEQNARAALRVADTAHVMEGGRIVLSGPAAELAADERVRAAYLGGPSLGGEVAA
jgi:branched-chain amino acid transport system ATP-binding protein